MATLEVSIQNHVGKIQLNRPEAFNAFDLDLCQNFHRSLRELAESPEVRALVILGGDRAFSSGGDLRWMKQHLDQLGSSVFELAGCFHESILTLRTMEKPVIAAVKGVAAGAGFSLALACDFRVLGENAKFVHAYSSAGLCFDGGGSFHLARIVGLARSLEIAAFDQPIGASQALRWGVATKVTTDEQVNEEAIEMAETLAKRSLHSWGWSKRLLSSAFSNNLETQLKLEQEGIAACAAHEDGREGICAFLEKRKPNYLYK